MACGDPAQQLTESSAAPEPAAKQQTSEDSSATQSPESIARQVCCFRSAVENALNLQHMSYKLTGHLILKTPLGRPVEWQAKAAK